MTGRFITLEGGEGSGKSTQISLLEKSFTKAGISCLKTREPGGSKNAESIRDLLVNGEAARWEAHTETVLFYAARLDHVSTIIKPALAENKTVICDRFSDSTVVYQGIGKNVEKEFISGLHKLTLGDFMPDLTLILDIDPETGLKRANERRGGEGRFESMDISFHKKIREGFLAIAEADPKRCAVIDAADDAASVHAAIIGLVNSRLDLSLRGA